MEPKLIGITKNSVIKRSYWIDYLRSTLTILVIAHHSAIAYATFGKFHKERYIASTSPVVSTSPN